ncbi:CCHC-type zinc finger, nucleic acid binding protein a [Elysia marginata]|uniref:CCHC-type zinc finger, nucleic acid binding protein a n=1 Tax=Elysia marginata TaxID=1093978 RepID=A0AAV4IT97_9GAST|nr:CCHC-type zinc finger, nucleic acid binding protein a [Elysia marginata]
MLSPLRILREHNQPRGKPRIITLYTQLTSMTETTSESVTDYVIRAETAAASLRDASETTSDSLLVAMEVKGLPLEFKSFIAVITQRDSIKFFKFKVALRNFEDSDKIRAQESSVMGATHHTPSRPKRWCKNCRSHTHDTSYCRKSKPSNIHYKSFSTSKWCDGRLPKNFQSKES